MMFKSALLALAATAGFSDALGINCRGSGLCSGNKGALGQLIAQVRAIDPNKTFRNGEHVSCVDINNIGNHPAICAFYQNIGDRSFSLAQTQSSSTLPGAMHLKARLSTRSVATRQSTRSLATRRALPNAARLKPCILREARRQSPCQTSWYQLPW